MARVALVPSAYPPTLGGVQELTRSLAITLLAQGDQVEVWWQQEDGVTRPTVEVQDDIVVRRFPFPLPRADVRAALRACAGGTRTLRHLRAAVREFRPDVLHVQCFGPNGVYATVLSAIARVPLVVTLQGETFMDDHDAFDHSTVLRTGLRLALRRAAAVTGCSQFTLDDSIARFGLAPERATVVFNGVDLHLPERDDVAGLPDRYVVALGRVVEKKGFDLLIRAYARVCDRHPDVALAIGGDGPGLPGLRALVAELGVTGRVRFLGRLSREQVGGAMARAEVFVMPSRVEPFGIVILEGWRSGRPVVASTHGGPPEFVDDGVSGLLVDPFDTDAFARSLDRLLSDSGLRARLAAAGTEAVRAFSWPRIAGQYRERAYATLGA